MTEYKITIEEKERTTRESKMYHIYVGGDYTPQFLAYAIKHELEREDGEQYNFHVKSIEEIEGSN